MRYGTVIIFLLVLANGPAFADRTTHKDTKKNRQAEQTVAADPHVVLSACVVSGDVTVHGWDRKEVRARSDSGNQIELTQADPARRGPATELLITASGRRSGSCLQFGDIELDVPRGASLKLQTTSGDVKVTDVARVSASSQSGTVALVTVHDGGSANTIGGDISLRDSTGSFKLHTVSGAIDAHELRPSAATDGLAISTVSGEVTLGHVQHSRISVNTVSGEVVYSGPLSRTGGRYDFQSISGRIRLSIPSDSSFRLTAALGEEVRMNSDFNLKYSENQNVTAVSNRGAFRRIDGTAGTGDSTINVSLLEGSLQITKQ